MRHDRQGKRQLRCHDAPGGSAELDGAVTRFELFKTFHGDLQGTGTGVMLPGGDPKAGEAGYVAAAVSLR